MAGEEIAAFDGLVSKWDYSCAEVPNEAPDFVQDHSIQFHPFMCRDSRGFARYANHSCDPNCGIKNLFRIVAMRNIEPNEEITWDYAMAENDEWAMGCECGSALCRGYVRGYRFLPFERRRQYAGFTSEWHEDPFVCERSYPELILSTI